MSKALLRKKNILLITFSQDLASKLKGKLSENQKKLVEKINKKKEKVSINPCNFRDILTSFLSSEFPILILHSDQPFGTGD